MASSRSNEDLSDLLVKAALNDPQISVKGYDASRIFALVSVLLASPSSPKKKLVAQMKTVYLFKISNAQGHQQSWIVDMKKKGRVQVVPKGEKPSLKPDVTIELSDKDCVGLATGAFSPQKLFAAKRIKVRGNLDRALLVEKIISHERQKIESYAEPVAKKTDTGRWAGVGKSKL